jgi:hypothetical protein
LAIPPSIIDKINDILKDGLGLWINKK